MTTIPPCPDCQHKWHGLPCAALNTPTPGRAGEPCACPTAFRGEQRP